MLGWEWEDTTSFFFKATIQTFPNEKKTVHSGGETANKPDSLISSIPSLLHVEKLAQSPELRASININLPVIRHGYRHDERTQPTSWRKTLQLGVSSEVWTCPGCSCWEGLKLLWEVEFICLVFVWMFILSSNIDLSCVVVMEMGSFVRVCRNLYKTQWKLGK